MKNFTISFLIFLGTILHVYAQPMIQWQNNFGGAGSESAVDVLVTSGGGYLVLHNEINLPPAVTTNFVISKLGEDGTVEWSQNHELKIASSMVEASDGGYIIFAEVANPAEPNDILIFKISENGDFEWEQNYASPNARDAFQIIKSFEGGYLLAISSGILGGPVGTLIKIDEMGNVEWETNYAPTGNIPGFFRDIKQTVDGGYVISGNVFNVTGGGDYWILKVNQAGNVEWEQTYGGSLSDDPTSVELSADGGYLITGTSHSADGDVGENAGQNDIWLLRLDAIGDIVWSRTIGGDGFDSPGSVKIDDDGGYLLVGGTSSTNLPNTMSIGAQDAWLMKLDESGNILWQNLFGGSEADGFWRFQQTEDEGFIVTGGSRSVDGDLNNNNGEFDVWVVKFGPIMTNINTIDHSDNFKILPNPSDGNFTIDLENEGTYQVSIIDVLGRQVYTKEIHTQTFEVSGIPTGTYWINIVGDDVEFAEKLIIQQ